MACGTLVPQPGIEPMTSALEVLTTGAPGKPLQHSFISTYHLSTEKPEIRIYQDVHVYIF